MFVYRPALCFLGLSDDPLQATWAVLHAVTAAAVGIFALAAGLAGFLRNRLSIVERIMMFLSAALLLTPITKIGSYNVGLTIDVAGLVLCFLTAIANWNFSKAIQVAPEPPT
jgi:TRAP-type uncharacterized transport system fused permease subunit